MSETALERLIRERTQVFEMRHQVELDEWAKREHRRIASRIADHGRGIGQQFRQLRARLYVNRFGGEPEYVTAMHNLRDWLDRPLPMLPLFTGEMQ